MILAGLSGGETVVTAGVHMLRAGQTVKPLMDAPVPPTATAALFQGSGAAVAANPALAQADQSPRQTPN